MEAGRGGDAVGVGLRGAGGRGGAGKGVIAEPKVAANRLSSGNQGATLAEPIDPVRKAP